MGQILASVELETDLSGVYTDVCDLFEPTGNLYKLRESIEGYGGTWNGCTADDVSYSVLATLNNEAAISNLVKNLTKTTYAQQHILQQANQGDNGVHSSDKDKPILFRDEDLNTLNRITRIRIQGDNILGQIHDQDMAEEEPSEFLLAQANQTTQSILGLLQ